MELLIYLIVCAIPGIIASARSHHNAGAIWAVSILLGWTGIGWLIALCWSFTSAQPQQIVINNTNQLGDPSKFSANQLAAAPVEKQLTLTADELRFLEAYRQQQKALPDHRQD